MTRSLCAAAALTIVAATSVHAQDGSAAGSTPAAVIRATDGEMTCTQIADEAAALSASLGEQPDGGLFGRLGGVAKAGAAMVIPGAGLVTAAADALTQPGRERREAEETAASRRWYYLNGLYAGLRCLEGGPAPASSAAAGSAAATEATSRAAPTPVVVAAPDPQPPTITAGRLD